jgi:hypothetical protein
MYFDTNPFLVHSTPDSRLEYWKELRKKIANMPDRDALDLLAEYWAMVPLSNFSYNPEQPDLWPTPWEMVYRGDWCADMVPVGMEATLRLSGWDATRLSIVAFRDYDISQEITVLKIDDTYALNYTVGKVIEWPTTEKIITAIWSYKDRSYVSQTTK